MSIIRAPYQPNRYRGALDSLAVYHLLDKYFKPEQRILDPMAGGKTVEKVAIQLGMSCESNDLAHEGWDAREEWPFENHVFHGVILHPPYFKAKKYSDDERDIGNITSIQEYVITIVKMLKEAKRVTIPAGYIILIIGDYRKKGRMHLIHAHIYEYACEMTHPAIGIVGLILENYDLWEISATGTPFISTKHMIMFNWCLAFRRPEAKLTEYLKEE